MSSEADKVNTIVNNCDSDTEKCISHEITEKKQENIDSGSLDSIKDFETNNDVVKSRICNSLSNNNENDMSSSSSNISACTASHELKSNVSSNHIELAKYEKLEHNSKNEFLDNIAGKNGTLKGTGMKEVNENFEDIQKENVESIQNNEDLLIKTKNYEGENDCINSTENKESLIESKNISTSSENKDFLLSPTVKNNVALEDSMLNSNHQENKVGEEKTNINISCEISNNIKETLKNEQSKIGCENIESTLPPLHEDIDNENSCTLPASGNFITEVNEISSENLASIAPSSSEKVTYNSENIVNDQNELTNISSLKEQSENFENSFVNDQINEECVNNCSTIEGSNLTQKMQPISADTETEAPQLLNCDNLVNNEMGIDSSRSKTYSKIEKQSSCRISSDINSRSQNSSNSIENSIAGNSINENDIKCKIVNISENVDMVDDLLPHAAINSPHAAINSSDMTVSSIESTTLNNAGSFENIDGAVKSSKIQKDDGESSNRINIELLQSPTEFSDELDHLSKDQSDEILQAEHETDEALSPKDQLEKLPCQDKSEEHNLLRDQPNELSSKDESKEFLSSKEPFPAKEQSEEPFPSKEESKEHRTQETKEVLSSKDESKESLLLEESLTSRNESQYLPSTDQLEEPSLTRNQLESEIDRRVSFEDSFFKFTLVNDEEIADNTPSSNCDSNMSEDSNIGNEDNSMNVLEETKDIELNEMSQLNDDLSMDEMSQSTVIDVNNDSHLHDVKEDDNSLLKMEENSLQSEETMLSVCDQSEIKIRNEDSCSLFVGVADEMTNLNSSSLMMAESPKTLNEILAGSAITPIIATEIKSDDTNFIIPTIESATSLTDISTPNVESNINIVDNSNYSEFGQVLELDGNPANIKCLPLKNGHSLWNMQDLKLALSQNGSILLRLCATLDEQNFVDAPYANFTALMLDDSVPPTTMVSHCSNCSQSTPVRDGISQTNEPVYSSPVKMAYSSHENSRDSFFNTNDTSYSRQENPLMKRQCLPPPMATTPINNSPPRGKKRGRPPLHASMGSVWTKFIEMKKKTKKKNDHYDNEDLEMSLGYKKLLSLTCNKCGAVFRNKAALSTHFKTKHRLFKNCDICFERIYMQDKFSLRRHLLKVHRDRSQLKCTKCAAGFKVMLHLKRHDKIAHHDLQTESSEINTDSESENVTKKDGDPASKSVPLSTISQSVQPIPQTKESSSESDSSSSSDSSDSESSDEESKPPCPISKPKLSPKVEEKTPLKDTKSEVILPPPPPPAPKIEEKEECKGGQSGNESDVEDSGSESEATNRCKICKRTFTTPSHLRQHMPVHERKKFVPNPKQSDIPKKDTSKKQDAKEDAKKDEQVKKDGVEEKVKDSRKDELPSYVVRKGRILTCTKCNLSVKREKMMTYHLKKIHETLYPFRGCPHCGKIFRSRGPYTRHIMQHRSIYCTVEGCKSKYRTVRFVKKHQKSSHPDYIYKCTKCLNIYKKENLLSQHRKEKHPECNDSQSENDERNEQMNSPSPDHKPRKGRTKPTDFTPTILSGKRHRHGPISYNEDDDEVIPRPAKRLRPLFPRDPLEISSSPSPKDSSDKDNMSKPKENVPKKESTPKPKESISKLKESAAKSKEPLQKSVETTRETRSKPNSKVSSSTAKSKLTKNLFSSSVKLKRLGGSSSKSRISTVTSKASVQRTTRSSLSLKKKGVNKPKNESPESGRKSGADSFQKKQEEKSSEKSKNQKDAS